MTQNTKIDPFLDLGLPMGRKITAAPAIYEKLSGEKVIWGAKVYVNNLGGSKDFLWSGDLVLKKDESKLKSIAQTMKRDLFIIDPRVPNQTEHMITYDKG